MFLRSVLLWSIERRYETNAGTKSSLSQTLHIWLTFGTRQGRPRGLAPPPDSRKIHSGNRKRSLWPRTPFSRGLAKSRLPGAHSCCLAIQQGSLVHSSSSVTHSSCTASMHWSKWCSTVMLHFTARAVRGPGPSLWSRRSKSWYWYWPWPSKKTTPFSTSDDPQRGLYRRKFCVFRSNYASKFLQIVILVVSSATNKSCQ